MSDVFWSTLPATIAACVSGVAAIAALVATIKGNRKIENVHKSVNGLLVEKSEADKQIGVQQEKHDQHIRDTQSEKDKQE
jgi:hypothetical protein